MALLNFLKPKNQLEEGGRNFCPVQRDAESLRKCLELSQRHSAEAVPANDLVCLRWPSLSHTSTVAHTDDNR